MSINIRFQIKTSEPKNYRFGDDISEITLGRDPALCQVVFPAEETLVGRQHCVINELAGRYRLETNGSNLVWFNGEPVIGSLDLDAVKETQLQLGFGGPVVYLLPSASSDLPPTVGRVSQPSLATITRESHRRSRNSMRMAMLGLGLVAIVGIGGYQISRGLKADVQELSSQQREGILKVTNTMSGFGSSTGELEPKLADALAKARESVYLVVQADDKGRMFPSGTAWVVDRKKGYLATNSHVADVYNQLPANGSMSVLSVGPKTTKLTVKKVILHPGYASFGKMWDEYLPVRQFQHYIQNIDGIPAYDVALLQVDQPNQLAPDIPIASKADIEKMTSGMPIGYVGFPSENVALGGVNLDSPSSTTQVGIITSITDYFNAATASEKDRLLIQHSISISGGASGSPMLNSLGHVVCVLSASNFRLFDGIRLGSPANIHYAQGVDLVTELLNDTANSKQAERESQWRKTFAEHFQPRRKVEARIAREDLDEYYKRVTESITSSGEFTASKTIVKTLSGSSTKELKMKDGSTRYLPEAEMKLDRAGSYTIAAATASDAILNLSTHEKSKVNDIQNGLNTVQSNIDYLWLDITKPQELAIEPRINYPNKEVIVEATLWEKRRKSIDDLHKLLAQRWQTAENKSNQKTSPSLLYTKKVEGKQIDPEFEEVTHEGKKFFMSKFNINFNAPGPCVFTLVSLDSVEMTILIFKDDKGNSDQSPVGTWISLGKDIAKDKKSASGVVVSEKKAPYELRIYR